jgi:probable HAF family extracellular repeat protein
MTRYCCIFIRPPPAALAGDADAVTMRSVDLRVGSVEVASGASFSITDAYGINNAGQIVGYYYNSTGTEHGYVYTGGSFTTIDVPGATGTGAHGINKAGQISGFYIVGNPLPAAHGFVATAVVPELSTLAMSLMPAAVGLLTFAIRRRARPRA